MEVALSTAFGQSDLLPLPTWFEAVAIILAIPLGQLTHELAHYTIAHLLGAGPRLNLSVREIMSVDYDEDIGLPGELYIGLAPAVSGVGFVVTYLLIIGWPAPSYSLLAGVLLLLYHSVPSRIDIAGLRQYTGPDRPLKEWEESMWKALAVLVLAGWVMALPYPAGVLFYLVMLPLAAAGVAMFGVAVYQLESPENV